MSAASNGRSMLFLAMQASIITSAIAIAPAIPMRQSSANMIGNLPDIDMISAVEAPRIPVRPRDKKQRPHYKQNKMTKCLILQAIEVHIQYLTFLVDNFLHLKLCF